MSLFFTKRKVASLVQSSCRIEFLEQRQLLTAVGFTVDPAQSSLAVSGVIKTPAGNVDLTAQSAGSLSTEYSGTIDADVEATTIQFSSASSVSALNSGTWLPGPTAADYGAFAVTPSGSIPLAVRGLVAAGSSAPLTIGANGTFSSTAQSLAITGGELDYTTEGDGSRSLVGLSATNGASASSTYIVKNGIATLTIPIAVTYTTSVLNTNDTQLTLTGKVVATAAAPVFPTSISGNVHAASGLAKVTVFVDSNNNGVSNISEPTTTTDASGNFTLLVPGNGAYIIRQILPSGYTQTTPAKGYGNHITISGGQSAGNVNFTDTGGVAISNSISGTILAPGATPVPLVSVFADANNNGKLDPTELSTATDVNGTYTLSGLAAGNYVVRQFVAPGYSQAAPSNNYGIHATLGNGQAITGANFLDTQAAAAGASISGKVFLDANADSKVDNGESGLSLWGLYIDLDNSHVVSGADPTTSTDTNGNFTFTGLAAGTYIVRADPNFGWLQTTPLKNFGIHVTIAQGKTVANLLFGEITDD